MKLVNTIAKWFGYDQIWSPIAGRQGAFAGYGSYEGTQAEPSPVELLNAYEDIVYSCVDYISNNVSEACSNVKLCVTTQSGQAFPKVLTRSLDAIERSRIEKRYSKYTRKARRTEEVIDHPVLELIERPNPHDSFTSLVRLLDVYLELCGSAFIYKARERTASGIPFGEVVELWLLPSHNVTIQKNDDGAVTGYLYSLGDSEELYKPADIIHIHFHNPLDPYGSFGRSPVRAVWQRVSLLRQEQASWQAVLANMAFPSALVYPPDGANFTTDTAERLAKDIEARFRGGNQGGVWVVPDNLKYQPVSTPPKDLAALQMYEQIKQAVCAAYGIPQPLLDMQESTYAAADTARRAFQETCLQPRVNLILEALNRHLVGNVERRLFLVVDDLIQPDRAYELQNRAQVCNEVVANLRTVNEGRHALGLPPHGKGDVFAYQIQANPVGTASAPTLMGRSVQALPPHIEKALGKRVYETSLPDAAPLAEALADFFRKHGQEVVSRLKGMDAQHYTTKAFTALPDWSADMAKTLSPILRAYLDEGASAVGVALGGDDAVPLLPVLELDKAVSSAALSLAKSTLDTTQLEIERATEELRSQIGEGLSEGEANAQLADRVKGIFTDLSEQRAYLIAETEASRAKHAGELIAIREAGVEAKKVWLADSQACDICKQLDGKAVALEGVFTKNGTGVYSTIVAPPCHPACRCTMQYEFEG